MSVDTYLKGKNLAPYREVQQDDVRVLVAPSLIRWAKAVHIDAKQLFVFRSFAVEAEHRHTQSCSH